MDKEGVLSTPECSYLFVNQAHPAIAVLRANKDVLKTDIDTQQLIDGEWFKVDKGTFKDAVDALRKKVLSKVHTKDLNNFSVELCRIGTSDWLDIVNVQESLTSFNVPYGTSEDEIHKMQSHHFESFLTQKASYYARLEITFEVNP